MEFSDYVIIDLGSGKRILPDGTVLDDQVTLELEVNIVHTNADTAFEDWMHLARLKVRATRNVGYWAWELEWLPENWTHAFGFYDEIWAATEFARGAFASGKQRAVRLVPMAVLRPIAWTQKGRDVLGYEDDEALFLFMFDFRSFVKRKNPEGVVTAFTEAFPSGHEKVRLIIKTQGADSEPEQWAKLKESCADHRIELVDRKLDRNDLLSLVATADAFVSLHRSEGFGRGPAEAMLMGVPVILTDYSGTTDFADPSCAMLVDYELIPVGQMDYPGVESQRWADPNIWTAAKHMRWIYENPGDAKILGQRGRRKIEERYNASHVGRQILRAVGCDRGNVDGR